MMVCLRYDKGEGQMAVELEVGYVADMLGLSALTQIEKRKKEKSNFLKGSRFNHRTLNL